ncbi:hypothetical protein EMIT0194MI4_200023 [Pseudomonas sp. IT-194MI4]
MGAVDPAAAGAGPDHLGHRRAKRRCADLTGFAQATPDLWERGLPTTQALRSVSYTAVILSRAACSHRDWVESSREVRPVMFRDVECAPFPVNRGDRLAIMGG